MKLCSVLLAPLLTVFPMVSTAIASPESSLDGEEQDTIQDSAPPSEYTEPAPENPFGPDEEDDVDLEDPKQAVKWLYGQVTELKSEIELLQSDEDFSEHADISRVPVVYGFFDLTFSKYIIHENSLFDGLINENTTFMMQQFNLYFASQLSESLSMLAELRFVFQPLGQEPNMEMLSADGNTLFSEYERIDTEYQDPFDDEKWRLGGVGIERLQLTWSSRDWFGIKAGRFLTPYGIWNIDHGSPVLITIRHPLLHVHEYIPNAQTGLQFFGHVYLSDVLNVEYAATLSNGRGPIDTISDYDNNKALGGRLGFTLELDRITAEIGGYGYIGDYTDIKRRLSILGNVGKGNPPIDFTVHETVKYTEYVASGDFLFEIDKLRIQGEFVRGIIRYMDRFRPERNPVRGPEMQPDYCFMDFYGLIAYELPLKKWLKSMRLMPYFLYEYSDLDDSIAAPVVTHMFVGGLNFKPSPYVALKLEYTYKWTPFWRNHGADFQAIASQMAVSF